MSKSSEAKAQMDMEYLDPADVTPPEGEVMSNIPERLLPKLKVMGMALLGDKLIVVYYKLKYVYFYKIKSLNPFHAHQSIADAALEHPCGIAANDLTKTAYITDWSEWFSGYLYKIDEDGESLPLAKIDLRPFGVSVTEDGESIIVIGSKTIATAIPFLPQCNKLFVFTRDGALKKSILLPNGLDNPRHALPVPRSKAEDFWIIHGWGLKSSEVIRIDSGGRILAGRYGNERNRPDQRLSRPQSLHDDGHRKLLVVDHDNHRVDLLDYNLHLVQPMHVLTERDNGIRFPKHVCADTKRGFLFVGFENGDIRAFRVFEDLQGCYVQPYLIKGFD